jgi:hypothetical protein
MRLGGGFGIRKVSRMMTSSDPKYNAKRDA